MNRSKESSPATDSTNHKPQRDDTAEPIEIQLDNKDLRAMMPGSGRAERPLDNAAPTTRDLIDTATNLELSQSLDDLRNLSWPGLNPKSARKPDQ